MGNESAKKMKLNLGCGKDIKKGYINLDFIELPGVDVVHDLNKYPWPFKNNEFDEIYASHVLEHLDNLPRAMEEIWRITKPNGRVIVRVPHFSCGINYQDPTHRRLFSYFTFDFFENKFKILKRTLNFTRTKLTVLNKLINPFINLSPLIYERVFCWIFPCSEVLCELSPKK